MALTRDFKETVRARAQRDPAFRRALLQEGVECLLSGDVDVGKVVLRDYINATIGFEELGLRTDGEGPDADARASGESAGAESVPGDCLPSGSRGVHLDVKASGYPGVSVMSAGVAEEDGAAKFGR